MRRAGRLLAVVVAVPVVAAAVAAAGASWSGPDADVELTFTDTAIVESSGLVALDDLVVTVNDSGDTGRVFAVDRSSGETVGVTTWSDEPEDVEAVAPAGPGEVWVADIGDNAEARGSVSVARVPAGRGDRDVREEVETYDLVYPDGPHDAETLLSVPGSGRLVVVTKGVFGGQVMLAPERLDPDGPNRLREVGAGPAIATDGAFWPDGRHLVVRGYSTASVHAWPSLELVERFDLPSQVQGEGIAVDDDGVVLISTEGPRSDVLRVRLPRAVVQAVAPEPVASMTAPVPEAGADDVPAALPGDPDSTGRSWWPLAATALVGAVALAVLLRSARSLRPRG